MKPISRDWKTTLAGFVGFVIFVWPVVDGWLKGGSTDWRDLLKAVAVQAIGYFAGDRRAPGKEPA